MFVSMPEFKFEVPAQLAKPGAFYARAMTLSSHSAWFIVTLRFKAPEPTTETFLLVWDTDVASVICTAAPEAELMALMFATPHRGGNTHGWQTKDIAEVWEATNPAEEDEHCILMVAEDGTEHSGYFMERCSGLKRTKLIARTRPTCGAKGSLDA